MGGDSVFRLGQKIGRAMGYVLLIAGGWALAWAIDSMAAHFLTEQGKRAQFKIDHHCHPTGYAGHSRVWICDAPYTFSE